jgi:hypothetical protein
VRSKSNLGLRHAIARTHIPQSGYDLAKGLRPRRSIKTAMSHEIMFYGIAQKDDLGLDRAVEEVKYRYSQRPISGVALAPTIDTVLRRMSRYGVSPNLMIIPPQVCCRVSTRGKKHRGALESTRRATRMTARSLPGHGPGAQDTLHRRWRQGRLPVRSWIRRFHVTFLSGPERGHVGAGESPLNLVLDFLKRLTRVPFVAVRSCRW